MIAFICSYVYCQVYQFQQMRSTSDQELFKPLSNRTRTRPQEIYAKFNSHLTELQSQISHFNKTQEKMSSKLNKLSERCTSSDSVRLKWMSQPKYQQLLLNCELPNQEANPSKVMRLQKKYSTKSGKSFNSFGLGSSMTSFMGFKSNAQSKLAQSKLISWAASKIKNKQEMQSTMIYTHAPQNPSNPIDNNFQITESIVFNNAPEPVKEKKKAKLKAKDLRQLIQDKQVQLQAEWQKTQRFRGKVSSYLGEDELVRLQKGTIAQTRISSVIEKIKKSRVMTSSEAHGVRAQRIFSQN